MLERFLNPHWQHPDPTVRREAVDALSPDTDAEAIAQVARDDALPAIRRLALRNALDLALLAERAEQDADETVREQALRRYRELLAGLDEAGPPLDERMQLAARSTDPALIEYLAREAKDDDLRAGALARVTRETVLRDVALNDASQALRLEALARIQDEALLARVQERSRKSDKRVSHAARERLDAIREARERPQRVAAEAEQICNLLDGLGHDGHWERDAARVGPLEERWQALDAELRQALEARFAAARQRVAAELAAYRAAAGASRSAREAAIQRLEALGEALGGAPPDEQQDTVEGWIEERKTALREARAAWKTTEPLPEADEQALDERRQSAETAVREAIAREQQRLQLNHLLAELQGIAARRGAIAEADVKALSRTVEELPKAHEQGGALAALGRRVHKTHQKLRDRLRDQASWKKDTLDGLEDRLAALKTAVTEGRTGEATSGYDSLVADLDALLTAGTSAERLARPRKRLDALAKEVKVMRAWGRFGAKAARERLCEQLEALKGSDEAPPAIAEQVRAARAAWKDLDSSGGGIEQSLWRRFDAAATEAYLPCKAYFAERASARKANLERRRALLQELEGFLAGNKGGPDTDWKGAVRFRRELLNSWRDAHPVERGPGKAVAAGFETRMAELDELLNRERERSLRQREQLISDAEALASSDDKKAAAEGCKRLQAQWRVTVPGRRGEENALWKRFRSACDAVFGERQQVFDEERASFKATLEQRAALCQRVEALASIDADGLDEAEHELNRIQGEWSRGAPMPKREGEALERRFKDAVRRFAKHKRGLDQQRRREALACMRSKAALCHEVECRADDGAVSADAMPGLEGRWQALGTLPDADQEAAMTARFQQSLAGAPDAATLAENLAARESLCLRLEILAGVDSPPEHSAARMGLQVARLASALKDRSQTDSERPEALLRTWCTTGPAPREHAAKLEVRFEGAWQAATANGQSAGT